MNSAQDRRDAADRIKYDGLTLVEVNVLVRANRYVHGDLKPAFLRRKEMYVREGYWDASTGEPTERGRRVIQIAYGEPGVTIGDADTRSG